MSGRSNGPNGLKRWRRGAQDAPVEAGERKLTEGAGMKTFQIWFVNEDVLIVQAEKAAVVENVASFYNGDSMVAAFSFEQILGFADLESIVDADEADEDE